MVNINLVTQEKPQGKGTDWGKALPVALLVLILVIIAYVGMKFYESKLDKEISKVKEYHSEKLDGLKGGNMKNVIDFQNRLDSAKELLGLNTDTVSMFQLIEKSIIPQVRITSLDFDGDANSIKIACVTDNFNSVAKQIWSFKKADYYQDVIAGETKVMENEGNISFDVTLRLKNKTDQ